MKTKTTRGSVWLSTRLLGSFSFIFADILRGGSRIFERGGLIIKKLYSKSVHGALIKYHFGSSRNDASLCAHKLIQV